MLIKLGTVTHSFDSGKRLVELGHSSANGQINVRAPTNQYFTPTGYDMLFYVSATGKSSHAKMVHLGSK